ncbi:hypothetical protein KR032_003163, partial [Drosophila birchii]
MNTRKKTKVVIHPQDTYSINAKICNLVAEYPCLYDRLDVNFLKTTAVKDVWKEIGNKLNMPAKTCQERWRNMRSSYARSIKGNPGATTYYLSKELEFLKNHITPGIPIPPRGQRSRVSRRAKQEVQSDEDRKPIVGATSEVKHAQKRNINESEDIDTSSEEDSKNDMAKKRLYLSKRRKENVQPNTSNGKAEHVVDFDEAFLQGLRPEINQMNFTQKLFFKRRIYDLLGEIFTTENTPPNACSEALPVNEVGPSPPQMPFSPLQLQLPKLIPKPQKFL